jgi:hypothetical protein
MAQRNPEWQTYHDRVIEIAANNLRNNFMVYTNPDGQKNTKVGELYPDIILTPKEQNTVSYIIEVETNDSVNAHEAYNQWLDYSKIGGVFYLLVPIDSRQLAETLCIKYGISAKYATYWVNNENKLQINYE